MRLVSGAVEGHFVGVESDAGPGLAEAGAQVFFAGHEIDGAGLRFVGEDEIHESVFGSFLPRLRYFVERFSGELFQLRVFERKRLERLQLRRNRRRDFPNRDDRRRDLS